MCNCFFLYATGAMHDISNAAAVYTQLVHLQPCMLVCYVTQRRLEAPHVAETQCPELP